MLARQAPKYQTVPTGAGLSDWKNANSTAAVAQFWTFVASMLFQVATLATASVALAQGGNPEVLETVLWLELIVQIIEVVWYSIVGFIYVVRKDEDIPVYWRYADWAFTTPVMLISIMFFTLWEADKNCMTNSTLLDDGSRIAALISLILADWLMLSFGWAYEASNPGGVSGTPVRAAVMLKNFYNRITMDMFSALYLGFIPFIGAFVPLFVIVGSSYSGWGLASILITFTTWLLYGVVAILGDVGYLGHQARNAWYNALDIFSKNAVGIVVAAVALNNDHVVDASGC